MTFTSMLGRRDDAVNCGNGGGDNEQLHLRILSIFIILIGSCFGALFPIVARRSTWLYVPKSIFDFAKYFGSGVIIATGFIHLLQPGNEELTSPCLDGTGWESYPFGFAFCLFSIFAIFVLELIAFRWGTAKLAEIGITHDPHGHAPGSHAAHGPEGNASGELTKDGSLPTDIEKHLHKEDGSGTDVDFDDTVITQIIGVAILEFGVVLHSVLIGLTLAVTDEFKTLFVVLIFHQTFEGLGVGSRLAHLNLAPRYTYIPVLAGLLYGVTTPIGIAVGLAVKSTYNPDSTRASIVSGVLDCTSAGILIYTGLVELLAHEFLFNKDMMQASNGKLAYALICMLAGCGIMALLGKWA